MTPRAWNKEKRRIRCWLTIRSTQAAIAGLALTLGLSVTAFRFSDWARLYEYKMLSHAIAERRASEAAGQQARTASKCREVARLIGLDSRLDGERYTYACSPSLAKKHPRLNAAWRQTLTLSEVEREDVLQELAGAERILMQGSKYAKEQSAFEARLKSKYSRACFLPWMPLEPDSPPQVQ